MATGTIQKNMVTLWTNPNPSQNFSPQTVSLDLSKYKLLYIDFLVNSSQYPSTAHFVNVMSTQGLLYAFMILNTHQAAQMTAITRQVDTTSSGVTFGNGLQKTEWDTSNATVSNNRAVPYRIYGVV